MNKTERPIATYSNKLKVANAYLYNFIGLGWDDLPDINSLHDCESLQDIELACEERMEEDMPGFMNLVND